MPGPFVPDDPVATYEGTNVVALADRRTNDPDVVLLWARATGRPCGGLTHRQTVHTARIDAKPVNAPDVFQHPFDHADD